MEIAGVAVAFGSVMYLVSRNVSVALSLLIGACIGGLLSGMGLAAFGVAALHALFDPLTIELAIAVALISGLGKAMKASGDLERMIDSLVSLFRSPKLLTMLLPALIGTINVPGGAIMSAPMVEANAKSLQLPADIKAAVNLFYRHIGYFAYPLYSSLILLNELLDIPRLAVIRSNVLVMLAGLVVGPFVFFRGVDDPRVSGTKREGSLEAIKNFFLGFAPILVVVGLVLVFGVPFYLAAAIGAAAALTRGLPDQDRLKALGQRARTFVTQWVDYKLALVIFGVMLFKSVIENSGVVGILAESLFAYGTPLPILVVILGLITAYVAGAHMVATGILAALFAPLIPQSALAPYTTLLFTAIITGYIVSPIHLCAVLTNQYFGAKYSQVVKNLALPLLAMLLTALIQLFVAIW